MVHDRLEGQSEERQPRSSAGDRALPTKANGARPLLSECLSIGQIAVQLRRVFPESDFAANSWPKRPRMTKSELIARFLRARRSNDVTQVHPNGTVVGNSTAGRDGRIQQSEHRGCNLTKEIASSSR
jgi:hypothetical protein